MTQGPRFRKKKPEVNKYFGVPLPQYMGKESTIWVPSLVNPLKRLQYTDNLLAKSNGLSSMRTTVIVKGSLFQFYYVFN